MIVQVCDTNDEQIRNANAGNATQVSYAKSSNCANLQPSAQEDMCLQNLVLARSGSKLLEHTNNAFLLIFFTGHPECVSVLHHFSQHSTTNKYHVLTSWRVFNANFKFLSTKNNNHCETYWTDSNENFLMSLIIKLFLIK